MLKQYDLSPGGGGPSGDALSRARAYAGEGDMRAARVEAMNAVEQSPEAPEAWRLLAESQIALGDYSAALTTVERARAAGIEPGESRDLAAEAAVGLGDAQRALDETAAGDIPEGLFAEAARVRGKALALAGDMDGAAGLFNESILLGPDNPKLWVDLGYFRLQTGEMAGAIEAAEKALELTPQSPAALLLKGRLARSQYGPAAGLDWFDRALAQDPLGIELLLERAATLGELGRMQDMLADTRAVLERDAGNPDALYLQAVLAARAREDDLARRLIELTGGARDGLPGMQLLSAALDLRAGNYQSAIRLLESLLTEQPANRDARRLLAAAQFGAGDMRAVYWTLEPLLARPDAGSYELILAGRAEERVGEYESAYRLLERAARGGRQSGEALGEGAPDAARLAVIEAEARNGAADEQVALIRAYLALGRTADARALA
ncbi:MAG: tetratricopeptide repeat protein, partial [Sphingomonadales bacterium]|nr:tetratricopeptide repeat protein [Sphingomonadales bacterium]